MTTQLPAPQQPFPAYPDAPILKKGNGLGIAALVIGILSLVGAFIPFLNYATGFLAFIGLVLGVIALFLKGRGKKAAVAGTILSLLAIILSVVMALAYTAAFASAVSDSIDTAQAEDAAAADRDVIVLYEVTGTSAAATITYSTYNDGSSGMEQATGKALPFSKEITVKAGGDFDWSSYTLTVTNTTGDTGDISCKITIDGEVISEQTSTGEYASAMCSTPSFGGTD